MDDNDLESEGLSLDGMFPEASRPPSPEPTISTYERVKTRSAPTLGKSEIEGSWTTIEIKLVGSHPLWAHHLWNAARAFATFLDSNASLYQGKNVLELGAGGGLPGLVVALNGARKTVLTDYPDRSLIDNLAHNVQRNIPALLNGNVHVQGYIWGTPVDSLLEIVPEKYDLVILSDLIFNHSQHDALLRACDLTLRTAVSGDSRSPSPTVLVFYTHHRPHLSSKDLEFFTKARERGWCCEEIVTERYPPMFPDDPGEEEVRATVHGWSLRRSN